MTRLSAEQTETQITHIRGLLEGHPEIGHRERDETGAMVWVVDCKAWAGIFEEIRALQRRGRDEIVDGYPRSSLGGGGSPQNKKDEDGNPLPPRSDPTGEAVIARDAGSILDRTLDDALRVVREIGERANAAKMLLMRLELPVEVPTQTERIWCQWHLKFGMQEPINAHGRAGDCQWCTGFKYEFGVKPPKSLLEAKARGERITQRKIDLALPKKRRKAS